MTPILWGGGLLRGCWFWFFGSSLVLLFANHLQSLVWRNDSVTPYEVASCRVSQNAWLSWWLRCTGLVFRQSNTLHSKLKLFGVLMVGAMRWNALLVSFSADGNWHSLKHRCENSLRQNVKTACFCTLMEVPSQKEK